MSGKKSRVHIWSKIHIFAVISACFLLAALLVVSYLQTDYEKELVNSLSFVYELEGKTMEFGLWEDAETETYYLFLPSCFDGTEKLKVKYSTGSGGMKIDHMTSGNGDHFVIDKKEAVHRITFYSPLGRCMGNKELRVLISDRLPALMLTVEAKDALLDPKEFKDKQYLEKGELIVVNADGQIACKEELDKFKVRGNLTAALDKKPFTFSFQEPLSICGMAPAAKWNLLANATDGSYLRNKIVLDMANACIEAYEPDGEFVELYLNGQYQGLYLLTEAVQVGENRLELDPENSWFLEMELDFRMEDDETYIITDKGQIFAVHTEKKISQKEQDDLTDWLNDIESALYAPDGISRESGRPLRELIDMESWAQAWLIQEISGDHDTGIASQFAYAYDKNMSPLYAGPVWDFDGTMGNVNTPMFENPRALSTAVEETRPDGNANQNRWLSAMYRHEEFKKIVKEKYQTVFRDNLEDLLENRVDTYVEYIERSAVLDAFRWHEKRLEWMFKTPEDLYITEAATYEDYAELECHVNMVKDFLTGKKDFLDELWIENADFCVVEVRNELPILNQDYNQTLYYWVERGTALEKLPYYESENGSPVCYVDLRTGNQVLNGAIIYEDCILNAVWDE